MADHGRGTKHIARHAGTGQRSSDDTTHLCRGLTSVQEQLTPTQEPGSYKKIKISTKWSYKKNKISTKGLHISMKISKKGSYKKICMMKPYRKIYMKDSPR